MRKKTDTTVTHRVRQGCLEGLLLQYEPKTGIVSGWRSGRSPNQPPDFGGPFDTDALLEHGQRLTGATEMEAAEAVRAFTRRLAGNAISRADDIASGRGDPRDKLTLFGTAEPQCPHCSNRFPAMPRQAGNCPACGVRYFKRTRPRDDQPILVLKDDLERLDEEWSIRTGEHEEWLRRRAAHQETSDSLEEELGREATSSELALRVADKRLEQARCSRDHGGVRNAMYSRATALIRLMEPERALAALFEVCYLDAVSLDEFSRRRRIANRTAMASGAWLPLVGMTFDLGATLGLPLPDLHKRSLAASWDARRQLGTVLEPETAWDLICHRRLRGLAGVCFLKAGAYPVSPRHPERGRRPGRDFRPTVDRFIQLAVFLGIDEVELWRVFESEGEELHRTLPQQITVAEAWNAVARELGRAAPE